MQEKLKYWSIRSWVIWKWLNISIHKLWITYKIGHYSKMITITFAWLLLCSEISILSWRTCNLNYQHILRNIIVHKSMNSLIHRALILLKIQLRRKLIKICIMPIITKWWENILNNTLDHWKLRQNLMWKYLLHLLRLNNN